MLPLKKNGSPVSDGMIAYSKELLPRISLIFTDYQRKIRANPRNPRLWFCFPVKNGRQKNKTTKYHKGHKGFFVFPS